MKPIRGDSNDTHRLRADAGTTGFCCWKMLRQDTLCQARRPGKDVIRERRHELKNFRHQALAVAVFLLLATLAVTPDAAATAQEKPQSKPPTQKQEKRVRGQRDMADGQIKDVRCNGRTMDMVFDTSEEILHLHASNYFKVDFSAINFTPKGTMNPCKEGKGMYARVYFYHIKGHPHDGDLISVQLRK